MAWSRITWLRRGLIVSLSVYLVAFVVHRIPSWAGDGFLWDFSNLYAGSRTLLFSENPYSMEEVFRIWNQSCPGAFLPHPDPSAVSSWAAVYLPSSLAILAPLSFLSPVPAHLIWLSLNLALFGAVCVALWKMGDIRHWEWRLVLVLFLLAWVPGLGVIVSGQLAYAACSLVILTIWAVRSRRYLLSGVLLGLATSLKFQIGAPFIVYYLALYCWRTTLPAMGIFAAAMLMGVLPLHARSIPWFEQWTTNVQQSISPGQLNDPRPGAPFRDDIINLQTILSAVGLPPPHVEALAFLLAVAAVGCFVVLFRHVPNPATDLLSLSLVGLLAALPVYHRTYDIATVALLGVWVAKHLLPKHPGFAAITWLLMAKFLIPFELVPYLVRHGQIGEELTRSVWWQAVVVPHHAWGVLLLTGWALYLLSLMQYRGTRTLTLDSLAGEQRDIGDAGPEPALWVRPVNARGTTKSEGWLASRGLLLQGHLVPIRGRASSASGGEGFDTHPGPGEPRDVR